MNLDEIRQILDLVREHDLSEFELHQENFKLRIRKDGLVLAASPVAAPAAALPAVPTAPAVPTTSSTPVAVEAGESADEGDSTGMELAVVKSPIVGTFYRSHEPGLPPFVDVGAAVKRGQVLCIIEAMKLMNEIESEYDGVVSAVYVENGQPVQYGERLFAIRTR